MTTQEYNARRRALLAERARIESELDELDAQFQQAVETQRQRRESAPLLRPSRIDDDLFKDED
jgi:hypothetical protein